MGTAIWSDLPPELAGLILSRLLSQDDRLSFGSVCCHWRLAVQQQQPLLPPALPWLFCFNGRFIQTLPGGELKTFPSNLLSCCGSWLFCEHDGDGTDACFFINPSSRKTIEIPECHFGKFSDDDFPYPVKMLVCSPDLVAGRCGQSTVALYRRGDVSWSICPPDSCRGYMDIAFLHGRLYGLTLSEELFVHDLDDNYGTGEGSMSWHVEHAIKEGPPVKNYLDELYYTSTYLVARSGDLLMVRINGSRDKLVEKVAVKVFKADLLAGRWLEVKSLDAGQALFVGRSCSKAILLPYGADGRFKGNRVYFFGDDLDMCCPDTLKKIPTYCFWDLGYGTISQVFLQRKRYNRRLFFSDLWEWFFHCS